MDQNNGKPLGFHVSAQKTGDGLGQGVLCFPHGQVVLLAEEDHAAQHVPLGEDVNEYLAREVLPYNPGAWIDKTKTKVGYEIPFTRVFYVYKELEKAADIATRIKVHEKTLTEKLHSLFGEDA